MLISVEDGNGFNICLRSFGRDAERSTSRPCNREWDGTTRGETFKQGTWYRSPMIECQGINGTWLVLSTYTKMQKDKSDRWRLLRQRQLERPIQKLVLILEHQEDWRPGIYPSQRSQEELDIINELWCLIDNLGHLSFLLNCWGSQILRPHSSSNMSSV